MSVKKRRTDLSITEKLDLLNKYDELNLSSLSQREAASKLGLPQSSLSKLLKSRELLNGDAINGNRKRKREAKSQNIDEALLVWFKQASFLNAPINRKILLQKANDFGEKLKDNFKATDGWLTRWKERHGIVYNKLNGEKQDLERLAAENWLKTTWRSLISSFDSENIFNADETAIYYQSVQEPQSCFIAPEKKIKDKITVLLICNMPGTIKMKPLVIGNLVSPRCFQGVKNLPVEYTSNSNSRITASIFEEYLRKWDGQLGGKKKKIALILDRCTSHSTIQLQNIELVFLPQNTKSRLLPFAKGPIKMFKSFYRLDMRQKAAQSQEDGCGENFSNRISILDTLHMTMSAWTKVTNTCITNSFKKSGMICDNDIHVALQNSDRSEEVDGHEFDDWMDIDCDVQINTALIENEMIQSGNSDILKQEYHTTHEEPERVPVSKRQALEAISVLRRALEESGATDCDYKLFYNIEDTFNRLYSDSCKTKQNII